MAREGLNGYRLVNVEGLQEPYEELESLHLQGNHQPRHQGNQNFVRQE